MGITCNVDLWFRHTYCAIKLDLIYRTSEMIIGLVEILIVVLVY